MISRESLARFGGNDPAKTEPSPGAGFDMDGYLAECCLTVTRRKPWSSHPGGFIYELAQCLFDSTHKGGSAAFTLMDGRPGFRCQHDGCRGKNIQHVFAMYPPQSPPEVGDSDEGEEATAAGKRGATQSQLLIECAADAELFHTPETEAFASLQVGDHREVWPVKSKGFRRWLVREFYQRFGKPPGTQGIQDALSLLEAKAQFDSPESQVHTRVAPHGDGIYVDLCNERWEAVEITVQGWRVVANPPVRFRRTKGMQSLPLPARDGSLSMLRSLINVGDDNNWILLLAWLVAAFRPQGPYPVLILLGEQGSAKSTTAKILRRIIDPAAAALRTPPREERDLMIAASNSWVVAYDNLSSIPQWLSDALCRLATGGGFSTRELYTDSDEVILDLTRPVILNGIDHLAERPDLADRAIILQLPRIEDGARRDEQHLYAAYQEALPQILGAMFTALSITLARLPDVSLSRKPRMADFALWATAAEGGLGFESGAFMNAYSGNRAEAVQETLETDPIGAAIIELISSRTERDFAWTGTSGELLKNLETLALDSVKAPAWPKSPRALSSRLRRLATFLRETGIEILFPDPKKKGTGGRRPLTITRTAWDLTATTATANPAASLNQQLSEDAASGGRDRGVADEVREGDQPPLQQPPDNQLNRRRFPGGVAEAAGEAVVCGVNLKFPPGPADQIDLCARCGRNEWQWACPGWICVGCGTPARKPARAAGASVDSAEPNEQPMSGAEATE